MCDKDTLPPQHQMSHFNFCVTFWQPFFYLFFYFFLF
uniref:Uncharacterized protein n=1 Tax=Anguilla anguilla TaxID=7936 RepID=A0A0E9QH00_ANGAN